MLSPKDSIAGTNFLSAVNWLSYQKPPKQKVTIAVLDTDIAIHHERFSNFLWKNTKKS